MPSISQLSPSQQRVLLQAASRLLALAGRPFHAFRRCVLGFIASSLRWSKTEADTRGARTGMLPVRAVLALSVKLWPARLPVESPVTLSGIVESVDAMVKRLCGYIAQLR